jgi:dimethylargininase
MSIIAITRRPTPALSRCELTHAPRQPIDTDLALAQHRTYESVLRFLGAHVRSLPPEPDLPDAVFVEDVAVVLEELAVVTNPGAPSRRAEVESVAAVMAEYRPVEAIRTPGTLDGGDVLVIDRTMYVGHTGRTNDQGIAQLRSLVSPHGYDVRVVPVTGCLHLKSACSHIGGGLVLVNREWLDSEAFGAVALLDVPDSEPRAANTFSIGNALVMAGGFPATRDLLAQRGYDVHMVDLSELQKAEAGGSCMSLVFGS